VTSRYIHAVDTALIMADGSIAGYIQGLLDGIAFSHTSYALDRDSRKSALACFLGQTSPAPREASQTVARSGRLPIVLAEGYCLGIDCCSAEGKRCGSDSGHVKFPTIAYVKHAKVGKS
jgi:hypothetical protein